MFKKITEFMHKPQLFEVGTDMFWNNEHISKMLLDAHISPDTDGASRKPSFISQSAQWIAKEALPEKYNKLLDLGCGPGLYGEQFNDLGYRVTGIDFSKRSIAYAKESALKNKWNIHYDYKNYLNIDYNNEFDVITLIYCDFGALSTTDRRTLLEKVYKALKPKGKFILDVFTTNAYKKRHEETTWQYNENGGFWSNESYISLDRVIHYDNDNTELRQSIVQTAESVDCYNIWEHFFTKEDFIMEMKAVGFHTYEIYGDVLGNVFRDDGDTICGIFTK